MKVNNSTRNRNKGAGLSYIKPMFPMENLNLCFKWKVRLIHIPRQVQISFFTPKARFNKQ